jgi:hypothetical protein
MGFPGEMNERSCLQNLGDMSTYCHVCSSPRLKILDMSDSYSSNVIMSYPGLHVTCYILFYSSFVSRKGKALIPSTLEEEGDRRLKSFGLFTFQSCVVPKVFNGVHSAVSIDLLKAFTCFPQMSNHFYFAKF